MECRRFVLIALSVALLFTVAGCATTETVSEKPAVVQSPEQKILYDLMAERCNALSQGSRERLLKIYAKDSDELKWIDKDVLPILSKWPATYQITALKSSHIIGPDAVARFNVSVRNPNKSGTETVDVVYVKESSGWKIDYVAIADK